MTKLSSKIFTHRSYDVIITDQILKIDKFDEFSSDIDFNSKTDTFRDVISLIILQCVPTRLKGASGGHKVSASRGAQASEARLYLIIIQIQYLDF